MPGVFVTAIGTDVGKTYVACALIGAARRLGCAVEAYKPLVTGLVLDDPAVCEASDSGRLLAALGRPVSAERIAAISPWCFRDPVSPDLAAQREGRTLDVSRIADFTRAAVERTPQALVIVEGIGGVLVPLGGKDTIADVIAATALPAILVSATYLGAFSHTLSALESLRARNIPLLAVALSESEESGSSLADARAVIGRYVRAPIVPFARDDFAATERAAQELLGYALA